MAISSDISEVAHKFAKNGYAVLPGFYDVERDILPVQNDVLLIVNLLRQKYQIGPPCDTFYEAMTIGYESIIRVNRSWGGEVYDAVKQIPAFVSLVSNPRNKELFEALRPGSRAAIAAGGYGIRIDNPSEQKFRALWHQEFPAQLRSLDGVVFWSPLLEVSPDMGPVQVAEKSHKEGPIPVYEDDGGIGKSGAYALRLQDEQDLIAKYKIVAPVSSPGDLILMDFLTLHQSGENVSDMPRWSMQFRYFNYNDPTGVEMSWAGSYASGTKFETIFPTLKREDKE